MKGLGVLGLFDLPPPALQLLIVIAGMMVMFGALFPSARRMAISVILFVVAYMMLPPLIEPMLDTLPLWILLSIFAILILNMVCEILVFLGFRRGRGSGDGESDKQERTRACIFVIVFGIVAFPFRMLWWIVRAAF